MSLPHSAGVELRNELWPLLDHTLRNGMDQLTDEPFGYQIGDAEDFRWQPFGI